ncbi:MAG: hypothetical protein D6688_11715 [Alphaproteobacteria bacterium]|nr:MAG: hypothetical protein D6688_11715 [Alphaproteobacteria bacterium]
MRGKKPMVGCRPDAARANEAKPGKAFLPVGGRGRGERRRLLGEPLRQEGVEPARITVRTA